MDKTKTKAYRAMAATIPGKTEQELANLLPVLAAKAAAAKNERAAAPHWHAYFAVEDALKAWPH